MKIILAVCVINVVWVFSDQTFNYEKMNKYGLGRRIIQRIRPWKQNFPPMFETQQHPSPLPPPKMSNVYHPSVYHNLGQGKRTKGEKRVFNNRFDYPERNEGQMVFFKGDFPCVLSRLAVETDWCLPTLMRGGVEYRHFTVLVRAGPGARMKGRVRAWCRNSSDFYLPGANW